MNNKIKEYRQEITEKVIKAVEQGTAPWQRPWSGDCFPQNAISKRRYNGSNTIILSLRGAEMDGGEDPRWITFQQALSKGWNVRKGEHGTRISFWKNLVMPLTDETGEPVLNREGGPAMKRTLMEKLFTVFHASQIEGIPPYMPNLVNAVEANEKADRVISDSGADIRHGGYSAFYRRKDDFIQIPKQGFFADTAGYYAALLHELIHWTGHEARLNRPYDTLMGSPAYAREELVAEMGSMFLSAETGIPQSAEHFQNHAAYIEGWVTLLRSDSNILFKTAAEASKAAEFLLTKEREREKEAYESGIEEGAA